MIDADGEACQRHHMKSQTFVNLQGMRAIASLMVFASHIFWPVLPMRDHWALPYVDAIGPAGVDIFFVISGFIVYFVAKRDAEKARTVGRLKAAKDFALRRILRIYPIYWIVFLAATLAMGYVELGPAWLEHKNVVALFFLATQPNDRILAAWTLNFEMCFYVALTLSILIWPRNIFLPLACWFLAIGGAIAASLLYGKSWMFIIPLAPILLEFLFGMVVAELIGRGVNKHGLATTLIGVIAFLIGAEVFRRNGGWFGLNAVWRTVCFGLPGAAIVYGMLAVEVRQQWKVASFWKVLGDASYSLYLWHQLIFAIFGALYGYFSIYGHVPRTILALIPMAAALGVGVFSYYVIERPVQRIGGRLLLGRTVKNNSMEAPQGLQNAA